MANNKLREDLEKIVGLHITRETHKGSVNRVRYLLVDQLLSLTQREVEEAVMHATHQHPSCEKCKGVKRGLSNG